MLAQPNGTTGQRRKVQACPNHGGVGADTPTTSTATPNGANAVAPQSYTQAKTQGAGTPPCRVVGTNTPTVTAIPKGGNAVTSQSYTREETGGVSTPPCGGIGDKHQPEDSEQRPQEFEIRTKHCRRITPGRDNPQEVAAVRLKVAE